MMAVQALVTSLASLAFLSLAPPRPLAARTQPILLSTLAEDDNFDHFKLYDSKFQALRDSGHSTFDAASSIMHLLESDPNPIDQKRAFAASKVLTKAMSSCGREREWKQSLQILNGMRELNLKPDTRSYNAALSACARSDQVEPLLQTLRLMSAENVKSDVHTFTVAIDGLARGGMTKEALKLFDRMGKNGAPHADQICYNAAVAAAARGGEWEQSLVLLKRMSATDGIGLSLEAVSGVMTACTRGDQPELALSLFNRMSKMRLRPDGIAFSTAMSAHSRAGQYGGALSLFRRMRREGVRRDVVAYNTMLHAAAVMEPRVLSGSSGDLSLRLGPRHAERLRTLLALEGVRANDITYSVLLQSLWDRPVATAILDEAMARTPAGVFPRCLSIEVVDEEAPRTAAQKVAAEATVGGTTVAAQPPPTKDRVYTAGWQLSSSRSSSGVDERWTLDLHHLSPGAAVAMALWLLSQLSKRAVTANARLPSSVSIITGWGKSLERRKSSAAFADDDRRGYRSFLDELALGGERSSVRRSVLEALRLCKVPTIAPEENSGSSNPGLVELDTQLLGRWAKAAIASGLIRGYFEVDDRLILGLSEEQARVIERAGRGA